MSESIVGHRIGIGPRVGVVYLGDIGRNDAAFGSDRDSEPDGDRVGGVTGASPPHDDDLTVLEQRGRLVDTSGDGA